MFLAIVAEWTNLPLPNLIASATCPINSYKIDIFNLFFTYQLNAILFGHLDLRINYYSTVLFVRDRESRNFISGFAGLVL